MRVPRSLLLVVLCACPTSGAIIQPEPPHPIIAYLTINADTRIRQSQGISVLSVPNPGWVFIVKDGMMVCGMEETAGGIAFPRTISIARLSYDTSPSIDVIALPPEAGGVQRLDRGCYASPTPDRCALCVACSTGGIDGMGCCVRPPDNAPLPLPRPCSF